MWLPFFLFSFFNVVSEFKGTLGHIINLNDCQDIFSNHNQSLGFICNKTKGEKYMYVFARNRRMF